jgi:hypothetical protein
MDFEHEIEENRLDADQLAALAELGIDWAGAAPRRTSDRSQPWTRPRTS